MLRAVPAEAVDYNVRRQQADTADQEFDILPAGHDGKRLFFIKPGQPRPLKHMEKLQLIPSIRGINPAKNLTVSSIRSRSRPEGRMKYY